MNRLEANWVILGIKCKFLKIILCYTTAFPMRILLTAEAVEFRIAPVVRGFRFLGVFGNRGGG